MRKMRAKKGFTLMEALGVVALIGILSAVTILIVVDYLRSTTKLEYDGYAKSIFVAAQNHLTMAEHEGFLGRSYFGFTEPAGQDEVSKKEIRYFVVRDGGEIGVQNNHDLSEEDSIFDLILPFASVDETVRSGSYIIRYQRDPAQVLDVFYWNESGRYAYTDYSEDDYLNNLLPNANDKDALRNYGDDGAIIGYYGGAEAKEGRGDKLDAPQLRLINAEKLYVLVDNPVAGIDGAKMSLFVRGLNSGSVFKCELDAGDETYWDDSLEQFKFILDDITTDGKHFSQVFSNCEPVAFQPGENILVYAVAYNDTEFTNLAYSAEQTTNSLFGDLILPDPSEDEDDDLSDVKPVITISNIRHLENLDGMISMFDPSNVDLPDLNLDFEDGFDVKQTTDLDWVDFLKAIDPDSFDTVSIFMASPLGSDSSTLPRGGYYLPVCASYSMDYDGQNHIIRNLKVKTDSYGGLFGNAANISVSNLMIEDPSITGATAGVLAGRLENSNVTNVLVCQSKDPSGGVGVTATAGYAGGLIGETVNVKTEASAAAVYVKNAPDSNSGNQDAGAGGLIGLSKGGTISGCYSAGITVVASYLTTEQQITDASNYNVSAPTGSAGGLVADIDETEISYSYSTCSVYGKRAGGFVGTSNSKIQNCYATGLVYGPVSSGVELGAFASHLSGFPVLFTDNWFFSIITDPMRAVGSSDAVLDGIKAFDMDTPTYQQFVSSGEDRTPASPYDDTLVAYYQGNYNLKTVEQLGYRFPESDALTFDDFGESDESDGETASTENVYYVSTHYGDWPAPEIMIINNGGNTTP